MTPLEVFREIQTTEGSLAVVARRLGLSKSYVSIMRKIAREGTSHLIGAWEAGMPFDLVRDVVKECGVNQNEMVDRYLAVIHNAGGFGSIEARGIARADLKGTYNV